MPRAASSATSRPILLRYLKRSVTVLATPVTRTVTPSTTCSSTPRPAPRGGSAALAGQVVEFRRGRLVVDGQPDLEQGRVVRVVEAQCRQQARRRPWHAARDFGQCPVRRHRARHKTVQAAPDAPVARAALPASGPPVGCPAGPDRRAQRSLRAHQFNRSAVVSMIGILFHNIGEMSIKADE